MCSTDCFSDFFYTKNLKSPVGLDDLEENKTSKATLDELKQQNSYFVADLVQKQENDKQGGEIVARKKKYIKGRVYTVNDNILVKHSKPGRRIVALNNDKNNMHVRRITSLYDKNGKKKDIIPIEKYPDIRMESGVEQKTFRKTLRGKPIQEKYLKKTKTHLNKWDMKKIIKSLK